MPMQTQRAMAAAAPINIPVFPAQIFPEEPILHKRSQLQGQEEDMTAGNGSLVIGELDTWKNFPCPERRTGLDEAGLLQASLNQPTAAWTKVTTRATGASPSTHKLVHKLLERLTEVSST